MRICTLLAAVAVTAIAGVAYATSPHFVSATGSVSNTTGDLTVSFKEAGLGNNQLIDYLLHANSESFTWQCFTKSGNKPQGSPQGPFPFTNAEVTGSFSSGKNGNVTGSLTLEAQLGNASCQGGGLKLCLIDAEYDGVQLTDTTNGITAFDTPENFGGPIQAPSKSNPGACVK
jgi:hypothetical protein